MKKIYCVFCGKENDLDKTDKCVNCKEELDPIEHPWKDYIKDHIKSELKGKVTDKTTSLVLRFVESHIYGFLMSALIVSSAFGTVFNLVKDNYITEVKEKPLMAVREEVDINSELIQELYDVNTFNWDLVLENSFYEDKYVNYNNFSDEDRLFMAYKLNKPETTKYVFNNNCEEFDGYDELYNWCLNDTHKPGDFFDPSTVNDEFDFHRVSISDMEKSYKDLFGYDKVMPKVNFKLYYSTMCEYGSKNDDYIIYKLPAGWPGYRLEFTKLLKAEKFGDTITLYDSYVYLEDATYKDKAKTKKISDIDYFGDLESHPEVYNDGQIYKHIYKKNDNGTYRWVSSEPVESI